MSDDLCCEALAAGSGAVARVREEIFFPLYRKLLQYK
jgi:hypothetical protein